MAGGASRKVGRSAESRNSTADRTIDLLFLFDERHPVRSAAELSELLDMPRSTTYRYLQTLRSSGLIEEDDDARGFRLGARVLQLARVARAGLGLSEASLPTMREVAARTGEAVLLTRRSRSSVVCVELVESSQPGVRLSWERGHALPVHAGASAKVLLAFSTPAEIDVVLAAARLPRYTARTIINPKLLRKQLEEIRAQGYAITDGEVDEGVRGIAAPIFSPHGPIAAGLSVAGPAYRLDDARLPAVLRAVREGAEAITRRLAELAG